MDIQLLNIKKGMERVFDNLEFKEVSDDALLIRIRKTEKPHGTQTTLRGTPAPLFS